MEGSDVTLPTCYVSGHPQPVVTWSKSFGQLPHGRVQFNSSVIKLLDVRKSDSDNYLCTAKNLLGSVVKRTLLVVVSLPQFTVKPPAKLVAVPGDTLTLNCSATGDPQPLISWKKEGAAFPVERSHRTNEALVLRDVKKEDAGNYICVATSAGVFDIETISDLEVGFRGRLSLERFLRQIEKKRNLLSDGYQLKAQGTIIRKEMIFVLKELSGGLFRLKISENWRKK